MHHSYTLITLTIFSSISFPLSGFFFISIENKKLLKYLVLFQFIFLWNGIHWKLKSALTLPLKFLISSATNCFIFGSGSSDDLVVWRISCWHLMKSLNWLRTWVGATWLSLNSVWKQWELGTNVTSNDVAHWSQLRLIWVYNHAFIHGVFVCKFYDQVNGFAKTDKPHVSVTL